MGGRGASWTRVKKISAHRLQKREREREREKEREREREREREK